MSSPKPDAAPAPPPASEEKPRTAGRRLEWPTLWHRDQLPFPWGSAKRLRKKPAPRLDQTAMDGLIEELHAALDRERP